MSLDPNIICPNCNSDIDSLIYIAIMDDVESKSDEIECKICGYRW